MNDEEIKQIKESEFGKLLGKMIKSEPVEEKEMVEENIAKELNNYISEIKSKWGYIDVYSCYDIAYKERELRRCASGYNIL